MPIVLEMVKLGFTREEIAGATKASVSTIQRDLQELRLRRIIPEESIKWEMEKREQTIRQSITDLRALLQKKTATPQQIRLLEILHAWLEAHSSKTQKQTKLPLLKNGVDRRTD
ncbi:MAG: hypothetical protein UX57_C0021G0002 [Candidatus Uhrbacteria bacterium GW2011_GWE2_46_68]|uniref:Uncharacterized protein n=2 Tax=Candidatus Uhriibacteriota TaxID=1752732 RepID=A0A0G1T4B1_9BACT|nr:MAG: hypothetical protein UX45_C0031G0008 [Candidatus Uhrbacteria bacterium GW2011_GWF2_46_218]KKU40270.1 MAG: hypothetical protein UX57_C0021G0002 [Candidatus Uhrbacteria bacterium GW2011_GWE2_46_68]